jgi:predicted phosphodiesterase
MAALRLAFIADIHANLPALEAVVADLQTQAPDVVYHLGDLVNRCPWPGEVVDLIAAAGWPGIYGNHDYVVARLHTPENRAPFTDRDRFRDLWWTASALSAPQHKLLYDLPETLRLTFPGAPPLRLLHGMPGNSFWGLYGGASDAELSRQVASIDEAYIVSAHTHRPLDRQVARWRLFNPGSVGMPYNEDPRAQYCLLDLVCAHGEMTWQATFRQVEYDRDRLATAFYSGDFAVGMGALLELNLRTALSGYAYISDFGYWLRDQPAALQADLGEAVREYLARHGPGQWAFELA